MLLSGKTLSRFFLLALLLSISFCNMTFAAENEKTESVPSTAEIKKVIKILEDPVQRDELLKTLKVMAHAEQENNGNNQLKSVAAQMLSDISHTVDGVTESIVDVAGTINEVPTVAAWIRSELITPKSRRV